MKLNIGEAVLPHTAHRGHPGYTRPHETSLLAKGDTLADGWGVTWVVVEMRGHEEAVIRPAK